MYSPCNVSVKIFIEKLYQEKEDTLWLYCSWNQMSLLLTSDRK